MFDSLTGQNEAPIHRLTPGCAGICRTTGGDGAAAVTVARSKGELPANIRQARVCHIGFGHKKELGQTLTKLSNP